MNEVPPVAAPGLAASALPGLQLRIGTVLALVLLLIGFISIVWTPSPADQIDVAAQLQSANPAHLLGTDAQGRDLLSLAMKGILTSFVVAFVAVAIGLFIGVPLGVAAASWGIVADRLLIGSTGFLISVSALGLAVVLTALSGGSTLNAMLAIGLFNAAILARATRDAFTPFRGQDYVAASRLAGLGGWDLARKHVLPDLLPALAAVAIAQLAISVGIEAGLSFVGLASQPPGSSLGLMLREAQGVMLFGPLPVLVPGVALLLVTLSLNLIAGGLRQQLREPPDAA